MGPGSDMAAPELGRLARGRDDWLHGESKRCAQPLRAGTNDGRIELAPPALLAPYPA